MNKSDKSDKSRKFKFLGVFILMFFTFALIFFVDKYPEIKNNNINTEKSKEDDIDVDIIENNIDEEAERLKKLKELKELEGNDWAAALEQFQTDEILLPLINFTRIYPDSGYIQEAELLIEQTRNDSTYSEKYFKTPTLDLIDEFILNFPGHKDIEQAYELREEFVGDIFSLIARNAIEVTVKGDSIIRCRIIIKNLTDSSLIIIVPFGTYLAANSGYIQNMLIREEKNFSIDANQSGAAYIDAACLNIYKNVPDNTIKFSIDRLDEDSPLINLLKILKENNSSYEIAQAAIWHMTDNPGKDRILNSLTYQDNTYAITEEDYAEALRLVDIVNVIDVIDVRG